MTGEIIYGTTGPFIVSIGRTTHGSETIARGLSYEKALALCETNMNLSGGNWKQIYPTSNGHHFYQLAEHEDLVADETAYVFMGCMGYFPNGTH